jgi:5-methylcytosine-specific restriction enzyme A
VTYLVERIEFTPRTKDKAWVRDEGKCRKCGVKLRPGKERYDHILPAALKGTADLSNCQVLCELCHAVKTKDDVERIRKSDRQRRFHNGTKTPPRKKIKSHRFTPAEPQRRASRPMAKAALRPRQMYEDMR